MVIVRALLSSFITIYYHTEYVLRIFIEYFSEFLRFSGSRNLLEYDYIAYILQIP